MRFLIAMIGYLATATVISAALGIGYLWQSEQLSDEKMFRIVALVQDVDIDAAGAEHVVKIAATPSQEPSLVEIERVREIALRNLEVKENALARGESEMKHLLSQLTEARERFDGMARELDDRIRRDAELADQESISTIVRDLTNVKPKEAKELLLRNLEGAGADPDKRRRALGDIIRLMDEMPTNTLKGILKTFKSPEELDQLHEIHTLLLEGGPQKEIFDEALKRLGDRSFSN